MRSSHDVALPTHKTVGLQGEHYVRMRLAEAGTSTVSAFSVAAPKSRYGRRSVPLSPQVCRDLWAHRKETGGGDSALVFASQTGSHLNPANLHGRWLKKAARAAGVEWAGFHTLRHTCATNLFHAGLNAKQVQVWLGHHSPAFTLTTYVHLMSDDLPASPFGGEGGNQVGTRPAETGRDDETVEAAETAV